MVDVDQNRELMKWRNSVIGNQTEYHVGGTTIPLDMGGYAHKPPNLMVEHDFHELFLLRENYRSFDGRPSRNKKESDHEDKHYNKKKKVKVPKSDRLTRKRKYVRDASFHYRGGDAPGRVKSFGTIDSLKKMTSEGHWNRIERINSVHTFRIQTGATCAVFATSNAMEMIGCPLHDMPLFLTQPRRLEAIEDILDCAISIVTVKIAYRVFPWGLGWLEKMKTLVKKLHEHEAIILLYDFHQVSVVAETKDRDAAVCLNSYGKNSGFGGFDVYSYDDIFAKSTYFVHISNSI